LGGSRNFSLLTSWVSKGKWRTYPTGLLLTTRSIYGEIGAGERVALSKLAIEKFEQTGRPLRIAVDISIWQFQIQAGQGGSNPAIRTFYYRLLRLLSIPVQPLFVFDGSHKPPFKRNKRTGQHGATLPNILTKQLLNLFGFPFYIAPGEAEAECALLQRERIVDAVLSEDVDTLMFGCGLTLRNWSSEGSRGNKSPTHVSVYDSQTTKLGKSGLDREGMVLVALMSGGDYITEGIPGCGIKLACEAARAGYGKSLCQLSRTDIAGMDAWRKNLAHEIQTNESKHFRIKHKTLKIPDSFPNKEVLGYYTHPVVSSASRIQKLKVEITWGGEVDVPGLRQFVAESFDWTHKVGAKKFIRGLAPAILVHKLWVRGDRRDSGYGDVVLTAMNEMELVRAICGKRTHFSTDGLPELRVVYHPADIVGIDLDAEEDDRRDYGRDGLAPLNEDDQIEAYVLDDATEESGSASPSKRATSVYDPTQPDKAWIPKTIAKVGIPLKVEDYEESLRDPHKFIKAKFAAKKAATKSGMPKGAMDRFIKITKLGTVGKNLGMSESPNKNLQTSSLPLPPVYLAPTLGRLSSSYAPPTSGSLPSTTRLTRSSARSSIVAESATTRSNTRSRAVAQKPTPSIPKTLSQPTAQGTPPITKYITRQRKSSSPLPFKQPYIHELSASVVASSPSSPPLQPMSILRKHTHSPQPESDCEEECSKFFPFSSNPEAGNQALPPPTTPSTPLKDPSQHSPCKKRPPAPASIISPSKLLRPRIQSQPLTPEPVNRKIDFSSPVSRARSSSPALPTVFDLVSPLRASLSTSVLREDQTTVEKAVITLSSSPPAPIPFFADKCQISGKSSQQIDQVDQLRDLDIKSAQGRGRKRYIMLRDSLPGMWKEADESEMETRQGTRTTRAWRQSQVEVVDLSEEP
jgi:Holliday junction resolvase YEN1